MLGRSKLTTWLMPSTVDAARGDIGGDQGFHVAPAKRREHALALTLRFVAVDRLGGDAGLGQLADDLDGAVLTAMQCRLMALLGPHAMSAV